jgi:hypothetical protein
LYIREQNMFISCCRACAGKSLPREPHSMSRVWGESTFACPDRWGGSEAQQGPSIDILDRHRRPRLESRAPALAEGSPSGMRRVAPMCLVRHAHAWSKQFLLACDGNRQAQASPMKPDESCVTEVEVLDRGEPTFWVAARPRIFKVAEIKVAGDLRAGEDSA